MSLTPSARPARPRPADSRFIPKPLPARPLVDVPETLSYRIKRKILGRPLVTAQLEHERLGNPTALAVFASDNLSSSAYATEEILHVLVPAIGVAAFSLVVPLTVAMLIVLGFLILSYRQTIKEYPNAGGAYVVTKDNFGIFPAQIAGVSLLTDYILTVAVSVSAGSAALVSAVPSLEPYRVALALVFIAIVGFLNLRGVKESGAIFAVPTYFFITMMMLLLGIGLSRAVFGDLPLVTERPEGLVEIGGVTNGLFYGAGLFRLLHAFASGGAAVTGVEAISNGVPAFRKPEWVNARRTLVVMGSLLGAMFLGLSVLAAQMHVIPFESGVPTVISEIGRLVFGESELGKVLYNALQIGTMLILVLAANTGFADFPRLAAFQAADNLMPHQLTTRGHRLVYSNGLITLGVLAAVLVIVTGAEVTRLIPMYAIGVFLGFTMSQAGMTRHHLRKRQPGWKAGLVINGIGAVLSGVVCIVFAVTKFSEGAWVILLAIPILVALLRRLHRQYEREAATLESQAAAALADPVLARHVVLVFLDEVDQAAASALRYARTLRPDELRAVHIARDPIHAAELAEQWGSLRLGRIPLELVECPDRRVDRAAVELAGDEAADGRSEVTVLLPRRVYRRFWHRLLHDRTADRIARELGRLPHVNVTMVPFDLGGQITLGDPVGASHA